MRLDSRWGRRAGSRCSCGLVLLLTASLVACKSPQDHATEFAAQTMQLVSSGEIDAFYDRICAEDREVVDREIVRRAMDELNSVLRSTAEVGQPAESEMANRTTFAFPISPAEQGITSIFGDALRLRLENPDAPSFCVDTHWIEHNRAALLLTEAAQDMSGQWDFETAEPKLKQALELASRSSTMDIAVTGGVDIQSAATGLLAQVQYLREHHLSGRWLGSHDGGADEGPWDDTYTIWNVSTDTLSWRGKSSAVEWKISIDCSSHATSTEFDFGEVRVHPIALSPPEFSLDRKRPSLDLAYFWLRKVDSGVASLRLPMADYKVKKTIHFDMTGSAEAVQHLDKCPQGD